MKKEDILYLQEEISNLHANKKSISMLIEIKILGIILIKYFFYGLLISIIYYLIMSIFYDFDTITNLTLSITSTIFALTLLYQVIGFKAGSSVYISNMVRSAWTNNRAANNSSFDELKKFTSLGNISWLILFISLGNFLFYYYI